MEMLTVLEALALKADLPTNSIAIKGVLFVSDNDCFVAPSRENNQIKISLLDEGIIDKLLENAACYVGGHYLYLDDATVYGVITDAEGDCSLSNIERIVLSREEEEIDILFS